jgi:hypothetical protein
MRFTTKINCIFLLPFLGLSFLHSVVVFFRCNEAYSERNCTLKKCYTKNLKNMFPEKELRGHSPNSCIHVYVCDYMFPQSVCLYIFCCRKIGGPIVGLYKSRSSFSVNTSIEISLQCRVKKVWTVSPPTPPLHPCLYDRQW